MIMDASPLIWPETGPESRPLLRREEAAALVVALAATPLLIGALGLARWGIFALALGLPDAWFLDKVDHSMASLAINHYPAQLTPPLPGGLAQADAGDHTRPACPLRDSAAAEWNRPFPLVAGGLMPGGARDG